MKYIVYRDSDGAILRTGDCPDDVLSLQAQTGETAIEGEADDDTHYIVAAVVTERPTLTATWDKTTITADGVDQATLGSTLPNPTNLMVTVVPEGVQQPDPEEVTTGTFTFATPVAGEYTILVTPPFPYIAVTQVIIAE